MISKELLSEVLEYPKQIECNLPYSINIKEVTHIDKNKLYFNTDNCGIGVSTINIHELAHKVKEFILKEYPLMSIEYWSLGVSVAMEFVTIEDKTEPEAIFKAGQWILDNQQNKRS